LAANISAELQKISSAPRHGRATLLAMDHHPEMFDPCWNISFIKSGISQLFILIPISEICQSMEDIN
jgi:hypothetical protein